MEITGIVTDANGQNLPEVNIVVKGTSNGTQTDFDGAYSLLAHNRIDLSGYRSEFIRLVKIMNEDWVTEWDDLNKY